MSQLIGEERIFVWDLAHECLLMDASANRIGYAADCRSRPIYLRSVENDYSPLSKAASAAALLPMSTDRCLVFNQGEAICPSLHLFGIEM